MVPFSLLLVGGLHGANAQGDLKFVGIETKSYPLNRPMKFKVKNNDKILVGFELVLLVRTKEDGQFYYKELPGGLSDKLGNTAFERKSKAIGRLFEVDAGKSITIVWNPLGKSRMSKPKAGRTYKLEIMTEGALEGGGPVYESVPFKFVSGR